MDYFDDYIKALERLNTAIDESIKLQKQSLRNFKPSLLKKKDHKMLPFFSYHNSSPLELEDHNFRIDSVGWKKYESDIQYLQNPEGDVWEYINNKEHPELNGEQLFTWKAAMRETKKAGKCIPTDEEFSELLKAKADMPNVLFAGNLYTDGSFDYLGTGNYFWSSTEAGSNAWYRRLNSDQTGVYRNVYSQAYGFSIRCLKSS